jgi:peptide-methionine (S)-S-oxide reductase
MNSDMHTATDHLASTSEVLVLGGGCFWCTEAVFKEVRGVQDVESGYSNGQATRPSYEDVCTGRTGCNEVIRIAYDPAQVSVDDLLAVFFLTHDPTTLNRQGHDVGSQYRSGIYHSSEAQRQAAVAHIAKLQASGEYRSPIVTEVLPLQHYWSAEGYHQDFFERNPTQGYCLAVAAPKVQKFRQLMQHLSK